jgi:hypothetical protein
MELLYQVLSEYSNVFGTLSRRVPTVPKIRQQWEGKVPDFQTA